MVQNPPPSDSNARDKVNPISAMVSALHATGLPAQNANGANVNVGDLVAAFVSALGEVGLVGRHASQEHSGNNVPTRQMSDMQAGDAAEAARNRRRNAAIDLFFETTTPAANYQNQNVSIDNVKIVDVESDEDEDGVLRAFSNLHLTQDPAPSQANVALAPAAAKDPAPSNVGLAPAAAVSTALAPAPVVNTALAPAPAVNTALAPAIDTTLAPTPAVDTVLAPAPAVNAALAPAADIAPAPTAAAADVPAPDIVAQAQMASASNIDTAGTVNGFACIACGTYNLIRPSSETWYVVSRGKKVGVFKGWETVAPLVNGVGHAVFKKYKSEEIARAIFQMALEAGNVKKL